ncbi:cellulase family glycosylhydrolase [Glycomyces sp. NPDC047369]
MRLQQGRRTGLVLAATAAAALAAATLSTAASGAAADEDCVVDYRVVSSWGSGFQASVSITAASAVDGWDLAWDFPGDTTVTSAWNVDWSQTGGAFSGTDVGWNGAIAAGQTREVFGFIGSGSTEAPTSFTLNGIACGDEGEPTETPTDPDPTTDPPDGPAPELSVSGNQIVTEDGEPYRLLGVSRSSTEFACVQGKGLFDSGPVDQASVDAMKSWNIRTVRLPLNEECWLGLNGSPSGTAYQEGIKDYVDLLVANGLNVILDLHWTWGAYTTGPDWHCTDVHATCQKPMPDAQYAPQFWAGVADTFKGDDAVVFDLFNEPYPDMASNWDKTLGWQCLRDGGTCAGIGYEVAGMQDLVDAVRDTGATNMLMVSGLEWTNDMREWLAYMPNDPLDNIAASWHAYSFNRCVTESCWDAEIAPLMQEVPVVLGEFGQDDCAFDYMQRLVDWADANGMSYLAWTWNPWGCTSGAVLIKDWSGTPEPGVGEGYRNHLLTQSPYL